jgi:hypothetical protein
VKGVDSLERGGGKDGETRTRTGDTTIGESASVCDGVAQAQRPPPVRPVDAGYRSRIRRTSRPAADDTRAADKEHSSGARHHREHIPASNEEIRLSSAANGIQRGDQRSVSERARVTLRADIPAGTGRLPDRIRACLFDMDGVLTETATLHAVGGAGLGTAVGSSSANCREVLEAAGIADLFDVRVDGGTIERDHLHGKPAPDSFLAAARELGMEPAAAAVFEDALAGVAAGRAGCFACVVGVDRAGQAVALRRLGADVVVADLAELLASS